MAAPDCQFIDDLDTCPNCGCHPWWLLLGKGYIQCSICHSEFFF